MMPPKVSAVSTDKKPSERIDPETGTPKDRKKNLPADGTKLDDGIRVLYG